MESYGFHSYRYITLDYLLLTSYKIAYYGIESEFSAIELTEHSAPTIWKPRKPKLRSVKPCYILIP